MALNRPSIPHRVAGDTTESPMASDGLAWPVENLAHDLQWAQYNLVGDRTDGFEWAQHSSQWTLPMVSDGPSAAGRSCRTFGQDNLRYHSEER